MHPTVHILQGHAPHLPDSDVNVVIDVIRAFTTTQVAFERGATEVVLVGEVDQARAMARDHPDYVLAGERQALKLEGFDLGNSPWECSRFDFGGRKMILTTTNGVRATLHAMPSGPSKHTGAVLVCGYTSAAQTADYLRRMVAAGRAARINLIASHPTGDEDLACAEFIGERLCGGDAVGPAEVERRILASEAAQKFLDPDRPEYDRRDIDICVTPRPSNFVMRVGPGAEGRPTVAPLA